MNCINLKQKLNHKFECKRTKKEITLTECKNCLFCEHKPIDTSKYTIKSKCVLNRSKTPLKRVSSKQAKTEKNRYSILVSDLSKCAIDGCNNKNVKLHEVYYGKNRQNSMKYGLVIPLCVENHHTLGKEAIHNSKQLNEHWRKLARKKFEEVYPDLDFVSIFQSK